MAEQNSLAGFDSLPPIPRWLPDETLFSLVSRYHVLSGHLLPSHTCRAVFGRARQGCEHDLPTRLSAFVERTQGAFGDARTLALERTVLPFYLPLRSPPQSQTDIDALIEPSGGMLKFRLGMLTSRFRANHPLKACVACMESDGRAFGTPYWHWEHQLPGVWICSSHHLALRQALVKSTGVSRFGWLLPGLQGLGEPSWSADTDSVRSALSKFAEFVLAWARTAGSMWFSAEGLARAYLGALERSGCNAIERTRDLGAAAESLSEALEQLRVVPELSGLPGTPRQASLLLDRWARRPRGGTHPLNHLAIISWLFPSWSAFTQAYEEAQHTEPKTAYAEPAPNATQHDVRRQSLISLIEEGQSVSAAGKAVGISVQTAASWAADAGIRVQRRAKILRGASFEELIESLRAGQDKDEIAARFSVSVQTVTRILRTEVGLQTAWHEARWSAAQMRARAAWAVAVDQAGGAGLTSVRHEAAAAYAWLYRNDRDWLLESSKLIAPARRQAVTNRVDWDARDLALSADVRRVAADIASRESDTRLPLWRLYQVLPELKAKLGVFDRLPLTIRAIDEVTGRPRRRRTGLL